MCVRYTYQVSAGWVCVLDVNARFLLAFIVVIFTYQLSASWVCFKCKYQVSVQCFRRTYQVFAGWVCVLDVHNQVPAGWICFRCIYQVLLAGYVFETYITRFLLNLLNVHTCTRFLQSVLDVHTRFLLCVLDIHTRFPVPGHGRVIILFDD
jgi:hypothetical protein